MVLEHLHQHKPVIDVHHLLNLQPRDKLKTIQKVHLIEMNSEYIFVWKYLDQYRLAEIEDETHPKRSLTCALVSSLCCPILGE